MNYLKKDPRHPNIHLYFSTKVLNYSKPHKTFEELIILNPKITFIMSVIKHVAIAGVSEPIFPESIKALSYLNTAKRCPRQARP